MINTYKYQDALDRIINNAELLQELVDKEKSMNICFKRIGNEDVPYCPRCKRRLVDDHLTYYNYCPSCGQRLK